MGIPKQVTYSLATASSAVIAPAQTASAATLNLVSNPVVLDTQRRVLITLTASASTIYTVSGTNQSGTAISEAIGNATLTALPSLMDFKTITGISLSAAAGGTVSVGTNGTGSTPWQAANQWLAPYHNTINAVVTTVPASYSLELTLDLDPCGIKSNSPLSAVSAFNNGTAMIAQTTSGAALISQPISAWRITNATAGGAIVIQSLEGGVGLG